MALHKKKAPLPQDWLGTSIWSSNSGLPTLAGRFRVIIVSLRNRTTEKEEGRTLVCDKRDKAISCVFCRDLHLTSMFSGLLQKDLFKGK